MKKTYIIPTLDVVRIETQHMIAVSGPAVSGSTNEVSDLLSREFDFDDDEEDW